MKLLQIEEVIKRIPVSPAIICQLILAKQLEYIRQDGRVLFTEDSVNNTVNRRANATT